MDSGDKPWTRDVHTASSGSTEHGTQCAPCWQNLLMALTWLPGATWTMHTNMVPGGSTGHRQQHGHQQQRGLWASTLPAVAARTMEVLQEGSENELFFISGILLWLRMCVCVSGQCVQGRACMSSRLLHTTLQALLDNNIPACCCFHLSQNLYGNTCWKVLQSTGGLWRGPFISSSSSCAGFQTFPKSFASILNSYKDL